MGRKPNDSESTSNTSLILLLVVLSSCALVYLFLSVFLTPSREYYIQLEPVLLEEDAVAGEENGACCRGIENMELWGNAVKWGSDFKFNSSEECCKACKAMCSGNDGPCLCDSWVFCGNREACGSKFGEVSVIWFLDLYNFLMCNFGIICLVCHLVILVNCLFVCESLKCWNNLFENEGYAWTLK